MSRHLWGGGNTSPLKTTAWEASISTDIKLFTLKLFGSGGRGGRFKWEVGEGVEG